MQFTGLSYRSPVLLSRLAIIGIGLDGILGISDIFAGLGLAAFPGQSFDLGDGSRASIWILLIGLVSLAKFPVYVFAVVAFLMWIYRGYVNLPALRSDNMEFSPGWAVGWWFVPFANLVKPFQAVRTLWSESDPDFDPEMSFLSSAAAAAPGFMAFWWGAWLLSNFAANISGRLFDPAKPDTMSITGYAFMISGTLTAIAALLALKVIYEITVRQEERFARIGFVAATAPPPPPTFEQQ